MAPHAVDRKLREWGLLPLGAGRDTAPFLAAAMIERFAADDPDAAGTVPAAIAIAALERRIAALREFANAA